MMARAKTDRRSAVLDRAPKSQAKQAGTLTDSNIAGRAYDLYVARGCEHGHDVEDWFQAERELRGSS